jgi:LysR family nitrogen assimilation transcriptional regulator
MEVDALSIIVNLVLDHGYLSVLPREAVAALDRPIGMIRLPDAPRVGYHLVWQRTQASRRIALQIAQSLAGA